MVKSDGHLAWMPGASGGVEAAAYWTVGAWTPGSSHYMLMDDGWDTVLTHLIFQRNQLLDFYVPFPDCSMSLQKMLRHCMDHTNQTHLSLDYDV